MSEQDPQRMPLAPGRVKTVFRVRNLAHH